MARQRIRWIGVAAVAVALSALPAQGAEQTSVATSFAGRIITDTLEGDTASSNDTPTYEVVGDCTYVGRQSGNRMVLTFTGGVVASGPSVAQGAAVYCHLVTDLGNEALLQFVLPGAVSVSPPKDTPSWPVAPITICAFGTGYFGPTPVHEEPMPRTCKRTLI